VECTKLLAALRPAERPLWVTALYAGLRRSECMALRVEDINLGAGVIHVRRGWDTREGEITPKNGKARKVPIATTLRDYLDEHLLGLGRKDGLVFGVSATSPFVISTTIKNADKRWKAAGCERITMHEARHTFASLMIAAGVNAKALSTYMGHSTISITLDLYGHLMPGNEAEAAGSLDAYLNSASNAAQARTAVAAYAACRRVSDKPGLLVGPDLFVPGFVPVVSQLHGFQRVPRWHFRTSKPKSPPPLPLRYMLRRCPSPRRPF
jgi:integrase